MKRDSGNKNYSSRSVVCESDTLGWMSESDTLGWMSESDTQRQRGMWISTDTYRAEHALWQRERYAEAKAAGLCPHCGKQPAHDTMVTCLDCRARHRRYARLYRARQREMRRQGITEVRCPCRKRAVVLCVQCQAPLCDTCYDLGEGRCSACSEAAHETG
jgi:hypothetical protein